MPEKETRKSKKEGHKVVSFERSPVMSTYLLAWAFGDFEYVEDFTRRKYNGKSLPVRVYTTKGLKDQGKLALESAHQIVDYFSEVCTPPLEVIFRRLTVRQIFRIDYPLPKVDLLAVHEFVSRFTPLLNSFFCYTSGSSVMVCLTDLFLANYKSLFGLHASCFCLLLLSSLTWLNGLLAHKSPIPISPS